MDATEKTEVLKGLVVESRKLSSIRVRDRIPQAERETVRNELAAIAERLVGKFGLSIPDARHVLHELLDVSV
jgi:hypothetical protein